MSGDFFDTFRVVLATSPNEKRRCFSLRHDVYCMELGYEPCNLPSGIETDEFDDRSLHCLIEHRATGLTAGCMRVVLPERIGTESYRLPIEEHFRHHGKSIDMGLEPEIDKLCEISRVAIPRYFRSGNEGDRILNDFGDFVFSAQERRLFPMIGLSLFLCATAITGIIRRNHVLAMMERRFQRLLDRSGIRFLRVSQSIEFRGERAAFYIDQRHAEENLKDPVRPLYRAIQSELSLQFFEKHKTPAGGCESERCNVSS